MKPQFTNVIRIGLSSAIFGQFAMGYPDGNFNNLSAGVDSNSYGKVEVTLGGTIFGKGTFGLSPTLPSGTPYQGAGTRMLWYPKKAAFRAGMVDSTQWDDSNIGDCSFAVGENTVASGVDSVALGCASEATGVGSTALSFSFASGALSVSLAQGITTGDWAVAMGEMATAAGEVSIAIGSYSTASGWCGIAIGVDSLSTGQGAIALGSSSSSTGYGTNALGSYTQANSKWSTALGSFNVGGGSPMTWVETDPIFEIGNGNPEAEDPVRSNAVTIYKNGNMDVQGDVVVGGAITCAPGGDIPMFGE